MFLTNVDYVPPNVPPPTGKSKLIILEDNDAVIKMCKKQRSPQMRHVPRTHRVDLDFIFDRVNKDPGTSIKFVGTKDQAADIFTKGSFSENTWKALLKILQVGKTRKPNKQVQHADCPEKSGANSSK